MLYDGAIRFMDQGIAAIEQSDLEVQNQSIQKAQRIVMELMSCLDMRQGSEIAKNLLSLYTFVLQELVEGNMKDDADAIKRARKVMSDLREGWDELSQQTKIHEANDSPSEMHVAA